MNDRQRLKVLLVSHGCSPVRGSELGTAWNWAWELAALNEVWLLAHPAFADEVNRYLEHNPSPSLHIVWHSLPGWMDPWTDESSNRGLKLHYVLWHMLGVRKARRLHESHQFDVVHHVSWNTISSPQRYWRIPPPFVWGPVGGGQTAPPAFRSYLGSGWRSEALRTVRVRAMRFSPALRASMRHSELILAANHETASILRQAGGKDIEMLPDMGAPTTWQAARNPANIHSDVFTWLWVGRLMPTKCLPLALEALVQVKDLPVRLKVVGSGPSREGWEQRCRELGVDHLVEFSGQVDWTAMSDLYRTANAFMFTSLRDTSGNVVMEAMMHGLPILALNHQGVGCFVPEEAAIKVPVLRPNETVGDLTSGMRAIMTDPDRHAAMSGAALDYARSQTWDKRAAYMTQRYRELIARKRSELD